MTCRPAATMASNSRFDERAVDEGGPRIVQCREPGAMAGTGRHEGLNSSNGHKPATGQCVVAQKADDTGGLDVDDST